jgi:ABC-type uncharacterized transport system substrate-binding protein
VSTEKISRLTFFLVFFFTLVFFPQSGETASYKVLVVMSYHDTLPWEKEIRQGIESVLEGKSEIKYFYLDTKYNFPNGKENARRAYALYRIFQPDGVIAADDDAQSLFVSPYLKDKVKTPVIFCGVNADPGQYGYPASNVTGILERAHFRESVAFLQQLVPSVKNIGYIANDNSTGRSYIEQIRREAETYSAKPVAVKLVKSLDEAVAVTGELKKRSEALFMVAMEGLVDADNNHPPAEQIFRILSDTYGKPIISVNDFDIRHGLLCAVVKTGREQGATAAKMLLRAMQGTPVTHMPITRNSNGKRMINVTVMKSLGIKPRPIVLRGAELVKSE